MLALILQHGVHLPQWADWLSVLLSVVCFGVWTTPRTWIAAETVTASIMNTHVRDDLSYLQGVLEGAWTSPAFNAGDFTTSGGGTWTLQAGDVTTNAYKIEGKKMTVAFSLATTTIATAPATLQVLIPASAVATKTIISGGMVYNDGATSGIGFMQVTASGTQIALKKADGSAFANGTNAAAFSGEIVFEIN